MIFELFAYLVATFGEIGGALVAILLILIGFKIAVVLIYLLVAAFFALLAGLAGLYLRLTE